MRGAYFHALQTNGQIGKTCVASQKLRWPRTPRSLNPSLPLGAPRQGIWSGFSFCQILLALGNSVETVYKYCINITINALV